MLAIAMHQNPGFDEPANRLCAEKLHALDSPSLNWLSASIGARFAPLDERTATASTPTERVLDELLGDARGR